MKKSKFTELNTFLSSLYNDKLLTKDGHFLYRTVIINLSEMDKLNPWLEATDGGHAHIAAGYAEKDRAWDARGSGYANTVTEQGWQGFDRHLKLATDHFTPWLSKRTRRTQLPLVY